MTLCDSTSCWIKYPDMYTYRHNYAAYVLTNVNMVLCVSHSLEKNTIYPQKQGPVFLLSTSDDVISVPPGDSDVMFTDPLFCFAILGYSCFPRHYFYLNPFWLLSCLTPLGL